jgi:hypothetical protein
MTAQPWPPLHAYALAHRCPACKAEPGKPCNAPRKNAQLARIDSTRARFGDAPTEHDPAWRMHAPRHDAGRRHYSRDVGRAPWAEDREPGRRYDSLGDAWTPNT